jgi:glutamate-1-semialdehyde 2,1-aminomutase
MFSFFFSNRPVTNAMDAREADTKKFVELFHHCLENGVYLAPSAFEAGFISLAHSHEDVERTVQVFAQALSGI